MQADGLLAVFRYAGPMDVIRVWNKGGDRAFAQQNWTAAAEIVLRAGRPFHEAGQPMQDSETGAARGPRRSQGSSITLRRRAWRATAVAPKTSTPPTGPVRQGPNG